MSRQAFVLLGLMVILPAVPAAAAPRSEPPPETPSVAVPMVDRDGDHIADGLQQKLPDLGGARLEVIASFSDEIAAGNSQQTLPAQAVKNRFRLIPAFSASLNRGQIEALSHQPGISRIQEVSMVSIASDSSNRDFGTEAARADYSVDGTGVGICIVDTGIDPGHEQLDGTGKIAGWADFINVTTAPYDDQGHGSHVASIAAGDGTGGPEAAKYKGVAPGATLYGAKVLAADGTGPDAGVILGVEWCAAEAGVDIISLSLGSQAPSDGLDALSLAVNAAVDGGKIVVVAAGNFGATEGSIESPGAAEKAITVGAVAEWSAPLLDDNHSNGIHLASFTARGPTLAPTSFVKPDIVAPGMSLTAAQAGTASNYVPKSGTSMATPFTAGTIALMLEADSSLSAAGVKTIFSTTAADWGPAGKDNDWGWGVLDGHAAVGDAAGATVVPTTFPTHTSIAGTVPNGGTWTHTFTLTAADLGVPIAATIVLEGETVCVIDLGPLGCLFWDFSPDIEARLLDPAGVELVRSTCAAGLDCGSAGSGRQETLAVMPVDAGMYTIELWPAGTTGGGFQLDLSTGPVGTPGPDLTDPTVSLGAPANGATVGAPVSIAGTASDNVGVAEVRVEIYSRDTTDWWNGSAWQSGRTFVAADVVPPDGTSSDWSYEFDPPVAASLPYWVTARAYDAAGNRSSRLTTNFTIRDVEAPTVVFLAPTNGSTVGAPVTMSGTATDNVGVADVRVEIYNRDTADWWNGSDWVPGRTFVSADVLPPGGTSTTWFYGFNPPEPSTLPYWVTARSYDAAGNRSTRPTTNFTIGDMTVPSIVLLAPANGSAVGAPVSISGSASDNVGVAEVRVEIHSRDRVEWWNGSGWQTGRTFVSAGVVPPGGTAVDWEYMFDPGAGDVLPYWVTARAYDAAGNRSARLTTNFTIG